MKLWTYRDSKKRAWKAFSTYIRLRDCLKTTGHFDYGHCFTCGRGYPLKSLQAGHFVGGRSNSVLFDEIGVRAQCKRCNILKYGEPLLYRQKLVEELGEDKVKLLEDKRWQVKKYSQVALDALYHHYKQEIQNLLGTSKCQ